MTPESFPLMDLFERLSHGLELGVDDYLAAFQALRSGYGVGEKESLRRLCRLVWVKGEADGRVFDRLYAAMVAQEAMLSQESATAAARASYPKVPTPRQEDRDEATGPRQRPPRPEPDRGRGAGADRPGHPPQRPGRVGGPVGSDGPGAVLFPGHPPPNEAMLAVPPPPGP